MPRQGDWFAIITSGLAFFLSLYLFLQVWNKPVLHVTFPWFTLGGTGTKLITFSIGLYLDNLAVLMLVIVTIISSLVQLFSVSYLHGDQRYHLYFAYLGLFTFSMLGIVVANNLLLLFIFWELVGFSSYLLIGFWFQRDAAVKASKKAFLFNRVGDIGFLLGILTLYAFFQTFDLPALHSLFAQVSATGDNLLFQLAAGSATGNFLKVPHWLLTLGGLGLFCGCIGKSAQFPLQVWLPDAMEGPTPVSALIHAATMVAAGVYLLARCFSFFTEEVLLIMASVGTITAVLGAIAACAQYDIKKVLAFSTISQLGYMVMGMGVGAHDASLLHLVTHAFFKAALFLNAGIIIHSVHQAQKHIDLEGDEQDIRNMGGFRRILPFTFYTYLPATAALIGLPLFSGFLSKDAILSGACAWAALQSNQGNYLFYLVPILGFISVLLTGYYMARHCFFIFFGQNRLTTDTNPFRYSAVKEASGFLLGPVIILAILSFAFFFSLNPFHYTDSWVLQGIRDQNLPMGQGGITSSFLDKISSTAHQATYISWGTAIGSVLLATCGILLAWRKYTAGKLDMAVMNEMPRNKVAKLAFRHYYLDIIYDRFLIAPFLWLSRKVASFDQKYIDYSLNTFGKIVVILAKIIGWLDRQVVDGIINLIAWLAGIIGKAGRLLQNGKIQSYYIFSVLGLVFLVMYIIFFER